MDMQRIEELNSQDKYEQNHNTRESMNENDEESMHVVELNFFETIYLWADDEIIDEMGIGVICAHIQSHLVESCNSYKEITLSPAYNALMNAIEEYGKNPFRNVWIGEADEDPDIMAMVRYEPSLEEEEGDIGLYALVYSESRVFNESPLRGID
jgi:hypothetical protein